HTPPRGAPPTAAPRRASQRLSDSHRPAEMSLRQSGRGSAGFRRVSAPRIARPRPPASHGLDRHLVFYSLKDEVVVCHITYQITKTYAKSPQRNPSCLQTPCTLDLLTPVRGFRLTMPRHGMSMCAQIRPSRSKHRQIYG